MEKKRSEEENITFFESGTLLLCLLTYDCGWMLFRRRSGRQSPDCLSPQEFYLRHFRGHPMRDVRDRADYNEPYRQHDVLQSDYQQDRLCRRHFREHSLYLPAQSDQSAIDKNRHQSHCLHRVLASRQRSQRFFLNSTDSYGRSSTMQTILIWRFHILYVIHQGQEMISTRGKRK